MKKKQILILDDEDHNVDLLKRLISKLEGYEAIAFTDPIKAHTWIKSQAFDLALIDFCMPLMNGGEITRFIRSLPHIKDVPVIILSAAVEKDIKKEAIEAGANEFLNKPFDRNEFMLRVENLLKLRDYSEKSTSQQKSFQNELSRFQETIDEKSKHFYYFATASPDGIWDWNFIDDTLYLSDRWKTMIGFKEDELPNALGSWFGRIHPEDLPNLKARIEEQRNGAPDCFQTEYRVRDRQGHYLWMLCRGCGIQDSSGKVTRVAGTQSDIHARKNYELELARNAFYDSLTGLPNRLLFMERLHQAFVQFKRSGIQKFALLFIDLDDFKSVNDRYGHAAGDELLKIMAERFQNSCREADTVARLAGDEFVFLLKQSETFEGIKIFADRLLEKSSKPVKILSQTITPSLSIGISFISDTHQTIDEILREGDLALYKAKAAGKKRVAFFKKEMLEERIASFEFENSLKSVLSKDEISLFYHPVLNLKTGKAIGYEGLLRWEHPRYGLVFPEDFLPLAEESDLIIRLGKLAVEQGIRQLIQWAALSKEAENWKIFINLAAKQIAHPDFIENVKEVLETYQGDRDKIVFEFSESILVDPTEKNLSTLNKLKELGILLALDDFGSGRSSMTLITRYPFDYIKIDRSVTMNLEKGEEALHIFKMILLVSREIKKEIIVEGIETKEIYQVVQPLDVEYGQGFYFSKPLRASEISKESSK